MLEKDRFLEKISYLIFIIFIFLTQVLFAETTTSSMFLLIVFCASVMLDVSAITKIDLIAFFIFWFL